MANHFTNLFILSTIIFSFFSSTAAKYIRRNHIGATPEHPNIIVLMVDDMSFKDLQIYGNSTQEWTPIDELLKEGTRFTNAYSVDSLHQSSFMTGKLPIRIKSSETNSTTMANVLKNAGYYTGLIDQNNNSNSYSKQGFDYAKTDLSNPEILSDDLLTDWRAFLDRWENDYQNEHPFFFHFSFPNIHSNQYGNVIFKGSSKRGQLGDNINELGYAVGEIVSDIRRSRIDHKTLIVFMSNDKKACNSKDSFKSVPFASWMPGTVKSNHTSNESIWSLDLFLTFKRLAELDQNEDQLVSDGVDVWKVLTGSNQMNETRPIYFYCDNNLMSVRLNNYILHFKTLANCTAERYSYKNCTDSRIHSPPIVYDVKVDQMNALNETQIPEDLIQKVNDLIETHQNSMKRE